MRVSLIITRYPRWAIPFALVSMAVFRLPLRLNKNIGFWRLMGTGKNGGFDLQPDLQQWAILIVYNDALRSFGSSEFTLAKQPFDIALTPSAFINNWIKIFNVKTQTFLLEPIEGFGLWQGKEVFGNLPKQTSYEGKIAVLTRATIRLSKLRSFWKNVPQVNNAMKNAEGLLQSFGIQDD